MQKKVPEKIEKVPEKIVKTPSKTILKSKNTSGTLINSGRPKEPEKKIGNKENLSKELKTTKGKIDKDICSEVLVRPLKAFDAGRGCRKGGNAGGRGLGLMPCMKKKVEEPKLSKTRVKVLRNVGRPIPSVFVGPGVSRDRGLAECEEGETRKDGGAGDHLRRPEYNSIVCTIRKLEEARKKKVVGNFESLPGVYKEIINGKV